MARTKSPANNKLERVPPPRSEIYAGARTNERPHMLEWVLGIHVVGATALLKGLQTEMRVAAVRSLSEASFALLEGRESDDEKREALAPTRDNNKKAAMAR